MLNKVKNWTDILSLQFFFVPLHQVKQIKHLIKKNENIKRN